MNRHRRLVLLSLVAALGLAQPVSAGECRPFKAQSTSTATLIDSGPKSFTYLVQGEGQGTLLGRFALEAVVVTTIQKDGSRVQESSVTMTAANGDELYMEMVSVPGQAPTSVYWVTGGTGMFFDAEGTGLFTSAGLLGGVQYSEWDGEICLD